MLKYPHMKSVSQCLALVALSMCFLTGAVGVSYDLCPMASAAGQEQAMAGMGCHGESPAKSEKNCCVDLTCLKCFASPLAAVKSPAVEFRAAHFAFLPSIPEHFFSPIPTAMERPPKMA